MKFCAKCGAKLLITTFDRYFCPNCGMQEFNQDEEKRDNVEVSYCG